MKLLLVNPDNPVVSLNDVAWSRLNRYRIWKPLGLLVVAALTPSEWDVSLLDENLGPIDFERMERPDLVGITAFTSQAPRAYEIAARFRAKGVPVVIGGIHATFRREEALAHADAIVTGEAEAVWHRVLDDARRGAPRGIYDGGLCDMTTIPPARHDLLSGRYAFGSIQTTRGCPLSCRFCSVTAFNGGRLRRRPIEAVVHELRSIRERILLFVDDNLVGTRPEHLAYTKELMRTMIREGQTRPWICQATINFADDDELLALAAESGCQGVFVGFESPTAEGLAAVGKKFNLRQGRNLRDSVRRIQRHGLCVVGSFILGLDTDERGIGEEISRAAEAYGVDAVNLLILTPLPGTALFAEMEHDGRIDSHDYPQDWKYYTLTHPVATHSNLTWTEIVDEVDRFNRRFYSRPRILRRLIRLLGRTRSLQTFTVVMATNLSYRANYLLERKTHVARVADPDGRELR